jgi:hypothetical protein
VKMVGHDLKSIRVCLRFTIIVHSCHIPSPAKATN